MTNLKSKNDEMQNNVTTDEETRLKIWKIEKYEKESKKLGRLCLSDAIMSGLTLMAAMIYFRDFPYLELVKGDVANIIMRWIATFSIPMGPIFLAVDSAGDLCQKMILDDKIKTLKEELDLVEEEKVKSK